ncbi:MAG: META domain-containing protein [Spirochaetes bacterium]|nr:META domain-containing protein [Spirochaetota bacterium]
MKKLVLLMTAVAVMFVTGCQGAPPPGAEQPIPVVDAQNFTNVMDREWRLVSVLANGESIGFNRADLLDISEDWFENAFSIFFENTVDGNHLSGMGAPNRYFSGFTLGENRAISIPMVASTQMAAFLELEALREHDFFFFISNVREWNLAGVGQSDLELFSTGPDGEEIVLIFEN